MKRRILVAARKPQSAAERALAAAFHEPNERAIGCACGAEYVETRTIPYVDSAGTVHHYGLPCYRVEFLESKPRIRVDEMDGDG